MNITKNVADEFKDRVEELISKYADKTGKVSQEGFLIGLYNYAAQVSNRYVPARLELFSTHKTRVDHSQLDYNMIMMSIVALSWAVRMRAVKSAEGQCHEHQ